MRITLVPLQTGEGVLTIPNPGELKDLFSQRFGSWDDSWNNISASDLSFLEELSQIPCGYNALDTKTRALIKISLRASTTHLYEKSLRIHIAEALKLGISKR
jgi:alkylhydroperoxidase/carboxymuconolactone decarboxylase family protein YurZ